MSTWDNYASWFYDQAKGVVYDAYDATVRRLAAAVESDPESYRGSAQRGLSELAEIRSNLDLAAKLAADLPPERREVADERIRKANEVYMALAAPALKDAGDVELPSTGLAPVIVVLGIALGAGSVAWIVDSEADRQAHLAFTSAMVAQLSVCRELALADKPIPPGLCEKREAPAGGSDAADTVARAAGGMATLALGAAGLGAVALLYKLTKG